MSYEPSKRLYIKNIPPDCTKKDIIELIKNRGRNQPSNIEIGKRQDGTQNNYCHATVEGMKNVMEVINNVPIRGYFVTAEAAKPHFSIAFRDAKQKREREEGEAERQAEEERSAALERIRSGPPQLVASKAASFFLYKQKYARVASAIAEKARAGRNTVHNFAPVGFADESGAAAQTENPAAGSSGPAAKRGARTERRGKKGEAPAAAAPAPPAPPAPPVPTKEERKIAGLQAKLLALKAKMGK